MPVIPEYLRKQYRELVQQHTDALAKRIGESRADYALFDTSKPLDRRCSRTSARGSASTGCDR